MYLFTNITNEKSRTFLSQNNGSSPIGYWQEKLSNIAPILDFPTDRVRKKVKLAREKDSQTIDKNLFTCDRNLTQALISIAREKEVSLEIILLTAFGLLLYRYSQQEDILIGCLNEDKDKQLNLLPIRIEIKTEGDFYQLLSSIKEQVVTAEDYLNNISESLAEKDTEYLANINWQMLFKYQNDTFYTADNKSNQKTFQQELFLNICRRTDSLDCQIEYDSNLFREDSIKRIADNYLTLLHSIVAHPQDKIDSLNLISPEEKERVIYSNNHTQSESIAQCIHQLFEERVKKNPQAIAVICQEQELTYEELNQQANQLARYLQTCGVQPGNFVGLCIERSLEMVVAVMAILKAGGVYVPLDISNPVSRINFIIEDAGIKILLTQTNLLSKLPTKIDRTICLDCDGQLIANESSQNLNLTVAIEDLAHIVYTSGSTGKPKGVMLTHGNLSHYAQSLQLAFNITPDDVYLHRGSIALIVSARQLLMPLAQGATAVVLTTEEVKDPLKSFTLIKRHGVTIVDRVPSFWRNFRGILNNLSPENRESLLDNRVRLVAAGGEQVTPEIYQCWRETFRSDVKLANIYGQTEGTGVVTVFPIPENTDLGLKSLPVGSPIANMKVYLLDQDLQPVPIGVAAEIHISGAGVAKGYLNRPELTAEKFIPNPYVSGERLYKTGDLGRLLADGSIQFLGRVDRQVNINGLRIELGEIEAVLAQNNLVTEAAVTVNQNKLGETLTAYIVASSTEELNTEGLRQYLQEKLPTYMIPNAFVFVDRFPQTTSGKIDYRALSALKITAPENANRPRDPLETEITGIIEEILGIDQIGIDDNFIELGGNSLLAARLVTEIDNRYGHTLAISAIFQAATVKSLAQLIRQDPQSVKPKSYVPFKKGNSNITLFGIHNLGYGLEFYLPLAKYLDPAISLCGLSSSFSNETDLPHFRDIVALADYYTEHLQKIQPQGPYYLIGVSFGGVVAYEIAQRLIARGEKVEFMGLLDSHCPQGNAIYQSWSLKKRLNLHLEKIRTKGLAYLSNRIKWRVQATMDLSRYFLYQFDWIRNNFVDPTSRNYAQVEYLKQVKEHEAINSNYQIKPYPAEIHLFRAADDYDPKLEWQNLALSGLSIYDIPGEHLAILQEPNVKILAENINSILLKRD